jgi:hypothetical protein
MQPPADFCDYRNDFDTGALRCVPHDQPYPCPRDSEAPPLAARKGPREHVLRPGPPWRTLNPAAEPSTECGRVIGPRTRTVTHDQINERLAPARAIAKTFYELPQDVRNEQYKEIAKRFRAEQARALDGVCENCCTKMSIYDPWDRDPSAVIAREHEGSSAKRSTINNELRAMAAMARAHPDEFRALLDGSVTHLGAKRRRA